MKKLIITLLLATFTMSLMAQTSDKYRQFLSKNADTLEVKTGKSFKIIDLASPNTVLFTISSTGVVDTLETQTVTDVSLGKEITFNTQTGTSYTAVLTDAARVVTMTNASANTFTIPPYSSVAFLEGTQITVGCLGVGTTTLTAGAGVTFISNGDLVDLTTGSGATLIHTSTQDTWWIIGGIE